MVASCACSSLQGLLPLPALPPEVEHAQLGPGQGVPFSRTE